MKKTKSCFDLSLKRLKELRAGDFINRLHSAMYDNYYGGNKIVVKNYTQLIDGKKFGLNIEGDYLFTKEELEYIQNEPMIFDEFTKQGWNISTKINKNANFFKEEKAILYTEFTFTATKK